MTSNKYRTSGKPSSGRKPPVALLLFLDLLGAALLLGIFYVTNYMIETAVKPVALPTPTPVVTPAPTTAPTGTAGSAVSTTSAAQATPTPTVDPNDWRAKFADRFTDGEIQQTDTSYKSANISIEIKTLDTYDVTCYVADIYVADLSYFKTAFAKDADVMGASELTDQVAEENNAILAINGDHCTQQNAGPVIRNGQLYRESKSSADVLVMNYDGSMEVFSPDDFNIDTVKSEGAYQVWSFGPTLLDSDGQPLTRFNSTVKTLNPRTAVGYYEPGHYCFLVVGGRYADYSKGYTMEQLAQVMHDLGCAVAYNLDGGKSSEIIFMGKMLNEQGDGRRATPDILYITDK